MERPVDTLGRISATVYYGSTDVAQLDSGSAALQGLLSGANAPADFQTDVRGLICRIELKKNALVFLNGEYTKGLFDVLTQKNDAAVSALGDYAANCKKTVEAAKALRGACKQLVDFVAPVLKAREGILDIYGQLCTENDGDVQKFADLCRKSAESARSGALIELSSCFPAQSGVFSFPSTAEKISEKLLAYAGETELAFDKKYDKLSEQIYQETYCNPLPKYESLGYLPPRLFSDESYSARMRFVCTPFVNEAEFAVSSICGGRDKRAAKKTAQFSLVQNKTVGMKGFARAFAKMLERKTSLDTELYVFYGLTSLSDVENRKAILAEIAKFLDSRKVGNALFHDTSGNKKLFCEYSSMRDKNLAPPSVEAVNVFLTMPFCTDVIQLFRNLQKKVDEADLTLLRKKGALMGYIGLNEVVNEFVSGDGKNWLRLMSAVSDRNALVAKNYIAELASLGQLVDSGWEIELSVSPKEDKPFSYDYDRIRELSDEKLAVILRNDALNCYEKCGIAVRYCLLCGDDVSVWSTLEQDEMQKRIAVAIGVLSYLLDTQNKSPEVKISKDLGLAGALCHNGGTLIEFSLKAIKNFDWLWDACIHEMHHSFQHTLVDDRVQEWHTREFGVDNLRVEEWRFNGQHYIDLKEGQQDQYTVQIFEADTRIFAKKCILAAGKAWQNCGL